MKKYKLVVLTNALEGQDDEFNTWYTDKHLSDVLEIAGITAAQRFQVQGEAIQANPLYNYLAIYDIETDDLESVLTELQVRPESGQMYLSPAMDPVLYCAAYTPVTSEVRSAD